MVTNSEGATSGRIVRIQEPKCRQTSSVWVNLFQIKLPQELETELVTMANLEAVLEQAHGCQFRQPRLLPPRVLADPG
jgi:hypothetical protein